MAVVVVVDVIVVVSVVGGKVLVEVAFIMLISNQINRVCVFSWFGVDVEDKTKGWV